MEQHTKQALQHLELLEVSLKNQIELCTQHLAQVKTAKELIVCSAQLPLILNPGNCEPCQPLVVTYSPEEFEKALEDLGAPVLLPQGAEIKFTNEGLPLFIDKGQIKLEGDAINSEVPRCRGAKGLAAVSECIKFCSAAKSMCMETVTLVAYEAGLLTTACPACESTPCLCP